MHLHIVHYVYSFSVYETVYEDLIHAFNFTHIRFLNFNYKAKSIIN